MSAFPLYPVWIFLFILYFIYKMCPASMKMRFDNFAESSTVWKKEKY